MDSREHIASTPLLWLYKSIIEILRCIVLLVLTILLSFEISQPNLSAMLPTDALENSLVPLFSSIYLGLYHKRINLAEILRFRPMPKQSVKLILFSASKFRFSRLCNIQTTNSLWWCKNQRFYPLSSYIAASNLIVSVDRSDLTLDYRGTGIPSFTSGNIYYLARVEFLSKGITGSGNDFLP